MSRERTLLNEHECIDLLAKMIREYHQVTFIVDALDECEDADKLLILMNKLYRCISTTESRIKFFFSSRYQVEMIGEFLDCRECALEQCRHQTLDDMELYVKTEVKDREALQIGSRLLKGKYPGSEERLISILVSQAQGILVSSGLPF